MAVPFVTDLANAVGGNLADGVAKIISLFKVDPNTALQNQTEILKIQADLQARIAEATAAEVTAASANIQAEAKAGKFASSPRPLFMYLIEVILAFNCLVVPAYQLFKNHALSPIDLPSNLLLLFGSCLLGYTSLDQIKQYLQLPGDSQIQIPGIKIGNKS